MITWRKSYVYAGTRLLSTFTKNGTAETTEFQRPDRLGTMVVTNNQANTSYEQSTLPFGTALNAESSSYSKQVFTSYERSAATGLDYAQNRNYSSGQGRFTTVDPAQDGMNLYSYAGNDPINNVDPSGLNASAFGVTYYLDGFEVDAGVALRALSSGAAVEIPGGGGGTRWNPDANGGQGEFQFFSAEANGQTAWRNIQHESITATVTLYHPEIGSWYAGSATWSGIFYTGDTNSSEPAPEPYEPHHPPRLPEDPGSEKDSKTNETKPCITPEKGGSTLDINIGFGFGQVGFQTNGSHHSIYSGVSFGIRPASIAITASDSAPAKGVNYNGGFSLLGAYSYSGSLTPDIAGSLKDGSHGGGAGTPNLSGGIFGAFRFRHNDGCKEW